MEHSFAMKGAPDLVTDIKTENDEDSEYITEDQINPSLMYLNIKKEIQYETSDFYGEENDPFEITNDKKEINIKEEFDIYDNNILLDMKTEPYNIHCLSNNIENTECEIDIKYDNLEFSTNNETFQEDGLVPEENQSTIYHQRMKQSAEDPFEGLRLLLQERIKEISKEDHKHIQLSEDKKNGNILHTQHKQKEAKRVPNKQKPAKHISNKQKNNNRISHGKYKSSSEQYSFKPHTNVKQQGRTYECSECYKAFIQKHYLRSHIRRVHNGIRKYKCKECHQMFHHYSTFKAHIKAAHKKQYKCNECSKKFLYARCLKRHITSIHVRIKETKNNEKIKKTKKDQFYQMFS